MTNLTNVSETLFVPMSGRIYSSKYCPNFFYDKLALEIYEEFPDNIKDSFDKEEYTYIASAMRSKNMDLSISQFLKNNPGASIVNLGCGMESLYERNDNGIANWFELDLENVLDLRNRYFPKKKRDHYLAYSIFDYEWMEKIKEISDEPILLIAAGLFHYFEEEKIVEFLNSLERIAPVEIIFDAVSSYGIKRSRKYMKKMGREDALMYFSVDKPEDLVDKCSVQIKIINVEKYYKYANYNSNIQFSTKIKMKISDLFNMVKMIHFKIER